VNQNTQLWLITVILWTLWSIFRILKLVADTDLGDYGAAVETVLRTLILLMLIGFVWAGTFGVLWLFEL
jgi:hypothetical protein